MATITSLNFSKNTNYNDTFLVTVIPGTNSTISWWYRTSPSATGIEDAEAIRFSAELIDKNQYQVQDNGLNYIYVVDALLESTRFTYTFNTDEVPLGNFYQIGVSETNGEQITWASDQRKIYMPIPQASAPIIYNSMPEAPNEYANYYKHNELNLQWTAPDVPQGLDKYYYYIWYKIGNGEYILHRNPEQSLGYYIINKTSEKNIVLSLLPYGTVNQTIQFYIQVNDFIESPVQVYNTTVSNILVEAAKPTFYGNNINFSLASLHGDNFRAMVVRPNIKLSSEYKINAMRLTTNSPMANIGVPATKDFKYQIKMSYNNNSYIIQQGELNTVESNITYYIKYTALENAYTTLYGVESNRVGPYDTSFEISYTDALNQTITSGVQSILFDFREQPNKVTNVQIGRDGVISSNPLQVARLKSSDTIFFPNTIISDFPQNTILNGEHFIIAFQKPITKSYAALSDKLKYILNIYSWTGEYSITREENITPTYSIELAEDDLWDGEIYNLNGWFCYPIDSRISDMIASDRYYLAYVAAKDPRQNNQNYLDGTSPLTNSQNYLYGCKYTKPSLELKAPITQESTDKYLINFNNYSLTWPGILTDPKRRALQRPVYYTNISYSPTENQLAELTLYADQNSTPLTIVSEIQQYQYNTISQKYYYSTLGNREFPFEYPRVQRVYSRLKLRYAIGLEYKNNELQVRYDEVYSNIIVTYLEVASISQRPHSMGINDPDLQGMADNYLFSVKQYSNKKIIRFYGIGSTEQGTPRPIELQYDTSNGVFTAFDYSQEQPVRLMLDTLNPLMTESEVDELLDS